MRFQIIHASRVDVESRAPVGLYALRDSLDFRPRVQDQTNTNNITIQLWTTKNFEDAGSVNGNLVAPDDNIVCDFDFYLARKDLLYLDNTGQSGRL